MGKGLYRSDRSKCNCPNCRSHPATGAPARGCCFRGNRPPKCTPGQPRLSLRWSTKASALGCGPMVCKTTDSTGGELRSGWQPLHKPHCGPNEAESNPTPPQMLRKPLEALFPIWFDLLPLLCKYFALKTSRRKQKTRRSKRGRIWSWFRVIPSNLIHFNRGWSWGVGFGWEDLEEAFQVSVSAHPAAIISGEWGALSTCVKRQNG